MPAPSSRAAHIRCIIMRLSHISYKYIYLPRLSSLLLFLFILIWRTFAIDNCYRTTRGDARRRDNGQPKGQVDSQSTGLPAPAAGRPCHKSKALQSLPKPKKPQAVGSGSRRVSTRAASGAALILGVGCAVVCSKTTTTSRPIDIDPAVSTRGAMRPRPPRTAPHTLGHLLQRGYSRCQRTSALHPNH
jgi:hypothetical protein